MQAKTKTDESNYPPMIDFNNSTLASPWIYEFIRTCYSFTDTILNISLVRKALEEAEKEEKT